MRSEFKKAVSLLPENPVIIEVGSAIGVGVNYMLKHRPKAEIYAIEASLKNFVQLKKNVPETVKCHNYAIGRFNKRVDFYVGEYLHNSFFKDLLNKSKKIKMKSCSLDSFIEKRNIKPDFIRFDCYGSEYDIFKGTLDFLDTPSMILMALYKKKATHEKYYKERRRVMNKRFRSYGFKLSINSELTKHIHQLWVK